MGTYLTCCIYAQDNSHLLELLFCVKCLIRLAVLILHFNLGVFRVSLIKSTPVMKSTFITHQMKYKLQVYMHEQGMK